MGMKAAAFAAVFIALAWYSSALAADQIACQDFNNQPQTVSPTYPCSVVGPVRGVAFAQTVTAASAYVAGNAVGSLITLAGVNRVSGASVYAQSVAVSSKSVQAGQMDLVFFNANPTSSTCTDKTAFSVATADAAKIVGAAHVSDWTASALGSMGQMQQPPIGIAVPATALYACLVTRSTPTFTATTDIAGIVFFVQN